jgi:hypothetical protein
MCYFYFIANLPMTKDKFLYYNKKVWLLKAE